MEKYGVTPEGLKATQLNKESIDGSHPLLALSREHRSEVVLESPTALRRTFTLLELAKTLGEVEEQSHRNQFER